MDNFNPVNLEITASNEVNCAFFEHHEESILKIEITGKCSHGSRGENYGQHLYQKIGLALLKFQPLAVLIDLRGLEYEYGDRILSLFNIFSDLKIFDEDPILTSFVLSDNNKIGLSSLLQFNTERPQPPFYYDLKLAYEDLWKAYDAI